MSSAQCSKSSLPHVTKHHRHRRYRSVKIRPHQQHSSKAEKQPNIVVHTRIHTMNSDKISSADHSLHETTATECRKLKKRTDHTMHSISVTKLPTRHYSATTDVNTPRNENLNNECSSDLKPARENTQHSLSTVKSSSETVEQQLSAVASDISILNVPNTFVDSRTGYLGHIRRVLDEKKRKKKRRSAIGYGRICSPLCAFLWLIGCLVVGSTIAALIVGLLVESGQKTTITTTTIVETTMKLSVLAGNLLINGDGETGLCATGSGITHPPGWNYNGTITQIYYNNSANSNHTPTIPGPNDRGQCYFYGQQTALSSMWQTIDLTNYVDPSLIDIQVVKFNLSAWLGGYSSQDDSGSIALTFTDKVNQTIGSAFSIGPVLANDRSDQTSLIFRQTNGFVPIGARYATVVVTITRYSGLQNNGDVDNVAVNLYQ